MIHSMSDVKQISIVTLHYITLHYITFNKWDESGQAVSFLWGNFGTTVSLEVEV